MQVCLLWIKQQQEVPFSAIIHCFWSYRVRSNLIFRVFSAVSATEGVDSPKAELHGLQVFGAKVSVPRTARPSRKLESWQQWLAVAGSGSVLVL